MSLSAVIVDDEQLAREELAYLLRDLDIDVIAQGKNGVEAVNLIKEFSPDLVFLDVQMPGLDGFGAIKKLLDKKVPLPQIVFATAFDQYAVKAFEVNAVDYLLKPFDKKRVAKAVEKARLKLESAGSPSDQIGTIVKMLEQQQRPPAAKVLLKVRLAACFLSIRKISATPRLKTGSSPWSRPAWRVSQIAARWKSCSTRSIPTPSGAPTAPTW